METRELSQVEKERLYERLHNYTKDMDLAFEIDGPVMTTVKRSDGTFRNYEVGRSDFYYVGARFNDSGKEIFIFQPEDLDERYVHAEVKVKDIDDFFPDFAEAICAMCRKHYLEPVTDPNVRELMAALIDATTEGPDAVKLLYQLEAQNC